MCGLFEKICDFSIWRGLYLENLLRSGGGAIFGSMRPLVCVCVPLCVSSCVCVCLDVLLVIACRITAENPDADFQPTSGRIHQLNFRTTPDVWGYFSVSSNGGVHEFAG